MPPVFVIDRTTRTMDKRLGPMAFDAEVAKEMASAGQGRVIGGCEHGDAAAKIARVVRNAGQEQAVVCCSSYERADEIAVRCRREGVPTALVFSDHTPEHCRGAHAVATVPESLYRLNKPNVVPGFVPRFIFLVDRDGVTLRARGSEWGGGNRAGNIATYRAGWAARGQAVFPVAWLQGSPAAYMPDTLCAALGVEGLMFGDARTLRTAFESEEEALPVEIPEADVVVQESELDEPVTQARQRRAHLLLHVGLSPSQSEALLTELATRRGYPVLSVKPFVAGVGGRLSFASFREREQMKEIARRLTHAIAMENKQVIILADVGVFYDALGPRSALFTLAHAVTPSLLVAPGPADLSSMDIRELFLDIKRIEPNTVVPGIHPQ